MPAYVEVAVNLPQLTGVFDYHLPAELEGQVGVGHLVVVPFGSRTVQGVVLDFVDQPQVVETRPVTEIVDSEAVLTTQQIALAQHLAGECLAPLAACIGLMLPPGLGAQADVLYTAQGQAPDELSITQARLLSLLYKRGPLRGKQIDRAIPRVDWRSSARSLVRRGVIRTQPVLPQPRVRPKYARTAQLSCSPEVAEATLSELGRAGSKALARRQAILRFLLHESGPVDVSWIYAESGGSLQDLRYLSERGLVSLGESQAWRDPLENTNFQPYEAPTLTRDQQTAWQTIQGQLQRAHAVDFTQGESTLPILLHGVTGSGKTELYLHAVQTVLELGKQAIILVPEIALTPQTVRRFAGRFRDRVGLVHSGLSQGERYDTWRRARAGELGLVVGPRSALFTPFPKLGLIVVDESHDDTYYQSEAAPHYHAREAAITYAKLVGAVCLLGSATPDVISLHRCQQGHMHYLSLPARILAHRQAVQAQMERLSALRTASAGKASAELRSRYQLVEAQAEAIDLPPVSIVDMRLELQTGNRSIFSRPLQSALAQVLEKEQQAILFLNRRGAATYIFCRDCGQALRCPRCDLPLTYHARAQSAPDEAGSKDALRCHHCGYERKMPQKCPVCASQRIRHYGTGTQRVEAEVQSLFPQAQTLRWDYETTRYKGAHEAILSHFIAQRANVLIGTQMLAKGLDLPLVTLVGVILADVGLSLPDYRANERTFQVLTQVAGRAGRSPLGGQVILQTFQPEHYVIQAASQHDYQAFARQELAYRQQLGFPPFANMVRLEYRHRDATRAEHMASQLAARIRGWLEQEGLRATRLVGPTPCFFARLGGLYRWQLILSGPDPAALLRGRLLSDLKSDAVRLEVNPPNLL